MAPRRVPRIALQLIAAFAAGALCVAVAVLAVTGTFTGSSKHAADSRYQRLVSIYTSQDNDSPLAVILRARSLDDLVNRVETLNSVTAQNTSLVQRRAHRRVGQ